MKMAQQRPYANLDEILSAAGLAWARMKTADYLEAFEGHPKIGDLNSLKEKYQNTQSLAGDEQSSVQQASELIINQLAEYNNQYFDKFGFIFIVCATGKTALQMLDLMKLRIHHSPSEEIEIAAAEQAKITAIRIENIFCSDQNTK